MKNVKNNISISLTGGYAIKDNTPSPNAKIPTVSDAL